MRGFNVKVSIAVDRTKVVEEQLENAIEKALTKVGLNMERYAKQMCPVGNPKNWKTPVQGYVGGTLRGSITYALDGDTPHVSTYDVKNNSGAKGVYDTPAPKEGGGGKRAVYVGTNVYYAPHVEMGTSNMKPRPFIEPAVVGHKDEHKNTIKETLEGVDGISVSFS